MEPFKQNSFPTLGVEEEFHLIDPETADLTPSVNEIMVHLDADMQQRVCYELLQCVIENRTGVYRTADELVKNVSQGRALLAECCNAHNINLVASGSHPFGDWKRQPFIDTEHYQWVRSNHGYIANRMFAFGLHIHVGVQNAESAIYVMNEMRRWTYPLLAFSANSPYYDGVETGLDSTRAHLFHSMPRTKFAPHFKSFSELADYYEKLLAAGDITQPGDLWWIIRPQPPLGTVEFRIFDLPTSVHRIGTFAAILQAAVATYQDFFFAGKPPTPLHSGYLEQNWWSAVSKGLKGKMIEPETGEVLSTRCQLERLVKFVTPKGKELNSRQHFDFAKTMLEQGNEADQQRVIYRECKRDFRALEKELVMKTVQP
ncbi:MAG: YbdK family carboxylate-amine ligase [Candidatus Scalindua sp. AMX11]|nr:MAG: YbdK family carboxylate-amine ligase [Candidatus Scalindua sp.]NOG84344.1 YbdK family carboxylate-amine ligase [Planctomycetota bacterium]RZV74425.1 MAG: YbdK family carboxylate-amine ligase [Candidatus Scalindua sp. SCAELEC01]TDE65345.1 MAG: YbdK family carboxylate-amine ligase [Candidatus Scalindua sp. AMX11]GJQ60830.1 MAG: putative glutamate--cysteine ligase 2 [Candidatus Scalindua sp.]